MAAVSDSSVAADKFELHLWYSTVCLQALQGYTVVQYSCTQLAVLKPARNIVKSAYYDAYHLCL